MFSLLRSSSSAAFCLCSVRSLPSPPHSSARAFTKHRKYKLYVPITNEDAEHYMSTIDSKNAQAHVVSEDDVRNFRDSMSKSKDRGIDQADEPPVQDIPDEELLRFHEEARGEGKQFAVADMEELLKRQDFQRFSSQFQNKGTNFDNLGDEKMARDILTSTFQSMQDKQPRRLIFEEESPSPTQGKSSDDLAKPPPSSTQGTKEEKRRPPSFKRKNPS